MALPKKRHIGENKIPKAQRQFTDRIEPQESFKQALLSVEEQDFNILTYYGVGGIGKTFLQKYLQSEYLDKNKNTLYTHLNFEDAKNRSPYKAFRELSKNFNKKIPFTSFDIAYTIYWSKAFPESDIKKSKLPLLEEGNLLNGAVGLLTDTAVVSVGLSLISYASEKLNETSFNREIRTELKKLDTLDVNEIETRLGSFFAYDIDTYKSKNPSVKVVIFLDTYEALWQMNKTDANEYSQDRWIREDLIAQLHNVLYVLCGREKIVWSEHEPAWEAVLNQHILERLSKYDARDFLESCEIKDRLIQDEIIQSSEGYPFYLDLCVDTYMEIKKSDKIPMLENFRDVKKEEIFERFMRYLSEDDRVTNMLYILSHARFYTEEIFNILLENKYTKSDMYRLNTYSFIREEGKGVFFIHSLMRDSLIKKKNNVEKKSSNMILFNYYDSLLHNFDIKNISQKNIDALAEAFYHKKNISDIQTFNQWYLDVYSKLYIAGKYKELLETQLLLNKYNKSILGEEHPDTVISYNNLALLYQQIGKYEEALLLFQKVLKIQKIIYGEEYPGIAVSYNNLALLYRQIGQYEEALSLFQKSLKLNKTIFGEEHSTTATMYNNLATLYEDISHYKEALSLHKKVLYLRKTILGHHHSDTLISYNNLAHCYQRIGQFEEALPLFQKVLKEQKIIYGEKHPDIAVSYNNLALLYRQIGQYEEALSLFQKSLKLNKTIFGEEHSTTATMYNNLALVYQDIGQYEEALSFHKKALHIVITVLGEDHKDTAESYNNLATLYGDIGQYKEALSFHKKALNIIKKIFGEEHSATATMYNNLATLYGTIGQDEEALFLYRKAFKIFLIILGKEHPLTIGCYNNLMNLYRSMD